MQHRDGILAYTLKKLEEGLVHLNSTHSPFTGKEPLKD